MFFTLLVPVHADDMDELLREKEEIKQQMEEAEKQLKESEAEERSISQQLSYINSQIVELEYELNILDKRIQEAEQKIKEAEKELERIQVELDKKIAVFKERLVEIYKNGNLNIAELLTNSKSFTDFLVQMELVKRIAENDIQMLEEIEAALEEQEQKKEELEQQKLEVVALKEEVEVQMAELESKKDEQQQFLASAREEKRTIERVLEEEEKAHRQASEMIRRLELEERVSSATSPSELAWPTPSYARITSDYGWRTHPILRDTRFHTGIDIAAPMGSTVVAASDGEVVYAGWHGGYGKTVIIMHGGGITTLYAHLSTISVSSGQLVTRGKRIGGIGTTGLSTGPHLHFEVLENGQHTSPWQYLR